MQANASSKTVRKRWSTYRARGKHYLSISVDSDGALSGYAIEITGASPAYVEAVVEEMNIRINEMLYNLWRIAI